VILVAVTYERLVLAKAYHGAMAVRDFSFGYHLLGCDLSSQPAFTAMIVHDYLGKGVWDHETEFCFPSDKM
jgi:hypothetical protein